MILYWPKKEFGDENMLSEKVASNNLELSPIEDKTLNKTSVFGWIRFILLLALLFFVFHYAIGLKMVSGHSMNPTLHDKSIILINKMFFQPERGDIVIVKDPNGFDIVKRIVGLPNDQIRIEDGNVYVNDRLLKESYIQGKPLDMEEVTVKEGSYFIMGDNRTPGESLDSRDPSIGAISEDHIIGEKLF